jgi:hypothetical protein
MFSNSEISFGCELRVGVYIKLFMRFGMLWPIFKAFRGLYSAKSFYGLKGVLCRFFRPLFGDVSEDSSCLDIIHPLANFTATASMHKSIITRRGSFARPFKFSSFLKNFYSFYISGVRALELLYSPASFSDTIRVLL